MLKFKSALIANDRPEFIRKTHALMGSGLPEFADFLGLNVRRVRRWLNEGTPIWACRYVYFVGCFKGVIQNDKFICPKGIPDADLFRRLRLFSGLSVDGLAEALNLAPETVYKYETGGLTLPPAALEYVRDVSRQQGLIFS